MKDDEPLFSENLDDMLPGESPPRKRIRANEFNEDRGNREYAQGRVLGPVIGLILTASFSAFLLILALLFDLWLLSSGAVNGLPRRPMPMGLPQGSDIVIRMIWGLLMLADNIVIIVGAIQMKRLGSMRISKIACILSLIPCLGPCFILGIPFGIWGLVALGNRDVRAEFVK